MKKLLIIIALTGCSYNPVPDLRVSKTANFYQRDLRECEDLSTKASSTIDRWITTSGYKKMVSRCLKGRGHSIITDLFDKS